MEKKKEEKRKLRGWKNKTKNGLKYSRISIFFGLSDETCSCKKYAYYENWEILEFILP